MGLTDSVPDNWILLQNQYWQVGLRPLKLINSRLTAVEGGLSKPIPILK